MIKTIMSILLSLIVMIFQNTVRMTHLTHRVAEVIKIYLLLYNQGLDRKDMIKEREICFQSYCFRPKMVIFD